MSITDYPAPPRYEAAPTLQPSRFGLLSVAQMPEVGEDPHWRNGVEWEPVPCEAAEIAGHDCDAPFGHPKAIRTGQDLVVADPFVVFGSYSCSPPSRPIADAEPIARAHLSSGEGRAVEHAVYLGEAGQRRTLVSADTVNVSPGATGQADGTAVSHVEGLALLEQYLGANYGSVGAVHVPRYSATLLSAADAVAQDGEVLRTTLGTYVAAGGAYDGQTAPDGSAAADGERWLYATGRPVVRRSDVFVNPDRVEQSIDTANNDLTVLAERIYVVAWDCLTAAVKVLDAQPTA